jgi:hypothetical protein
LVRELNFVGGSDENPYKHLQDFGDICATLMISGMNHETLKWKAFPYLLGAKVIIYTDHATLKYLLMKKDAKP